MAAGVVLGILGADILAINAGGSTGVAVITALVTVVVLLIAPDAMATWRGETPPEE